MTISGIFKVGISNISMGGTVTPGRANDSQLRVDDNSSRILFNVTEDLGGGLAAIGQLDLRFAPDQAGAAPANNPIGSGNTYVGLRSTSWGTISLGRWDLHYGNQPDDLASKAGALMASSVSLMDFQLTGTGTAATAAVANATRTANVIKWDSPNWGGFAVTAAYSTSPLAARAEGDMAVTAAGQKTDGGEASTSKAHVHRVQLADRRQHVGCEGRSRVPLRLPSGSTPRRRSGATCASAASRSAQRRTGDADEQRRR